MRSVPALFLLGCALTQGCGDRDEGAATAVVGGVVRPGTAGAQDSNALFVETEFNDFHLEMSASDWDSIINDSMGDVYRSATLRWKGVTAPDIGVRPSGSSSRYAGNPKMSLKLKFDAFDEQRRFLGLKELKLDGMREGTMIKERLSYGVFRAVLPATPRAVHGRLLVNGAYRGVFLVEERVNGRLIKHRYGHEAGNLYRIRVDTPEAFTWRGSDPDAYVPAPWQPETNELGDHAVVPAMLDVLNHRPGDFGGVYDLMNLTTYLAVETALIQRDGYLRNAGPPHNLYQYHRPDTGRFEAIPWDVDQCMFSAEATRDLFHNFGNSKITLLVRDTPALRALYKQRVAELLDGDAHPDRMAERIDFIWAQIREAALADPNKLRTNAELEGFPDGLKRTARARHDSLRAQLAAD